MAQSWLQEAYPHLGCKKEVLFAAQSMRIAFLHGGDISFSLEPCPGGVDIDAPSAPKPESYHNVDYVLTAHFYSRDLQKLKDYIVRVEGWADTEECRWWLDMAWLCSGIDRGLVGGLFGSNLLFGLQERRLGTAVIRAKNVPGVGRKVQQYLSEGLQVYLWSPDYNDITRVLLELLRGLGEKTPRTVIQQAWTGVGGGPRERFILPVSFPAPAIQVQETVAELDRACSLLLRWNGETLLCYLTRGGRYLVLSLSASTYFFDLQSITQQGPWPASFGRLLLSPARKIFVSSPKERAPLPVKNAIGIFQLLRPLGLTNVEAWLGKVNGFVNLQEPNLSWTGEIPIYQSVVEYLGKFRRALQESRLL